MPKHLAIYIKLFKEGKVYAGLEAITKMLILNNDNEKTFNKLVKLYDYLVSNRDGLIPYKLRDNIKMPPHRKALNIRHYEQWNIIFVMYWFKE